MTIPPTNESASGGPDLVAGPQGPGAPVDRPGAPARQASWRRALVTSPAYMGAVLVVLLARVGA